MVNNGRERLGRGASRLSVPENVEGQSFQGFSFSTELDLRLDAPSQPSNNDFNAVCPLQQFLSSDVHNFYARARNIWHHVI